MDEGGNLPKARKKAEMILKVQKRYQQANTADLFNQLDDECEETDNPSK